MGGILLEEEATWGVGVDPIGRGILKEYEELFSYRAHNWDRNYREDSWLLEMGSLSEFPVSVRGATGGLLDQEPSGILHSQ